MRLFYIDPGLERMAGHHSTVCRNFVGRARARGIETLVFGHALIEDQTRAELGVIPLFRVSPYFLHDGDPLCGWLMAFLKAASVTSQDFTKLPPFRSDDVLYLTGCQPAQLLGLVDWLATIPRERRPMVLVDLIYASGMIQKTIGDATTWESLDPRSDARGILYRFVGQHLRSLDIPRLRFMTAHPNLADVYSGLLLRQTSFVPSIPFTAPAKLRNRAGSKPVVVAVAGAQHPGKGYVLVPEIFSELLRSRDEVHLLAHNSRHLDKESASAQEAIVRMATLDSRLTVDTRTLTPDEYQHMLNDIDLMLCPYNPHFYRNARSGLATECFAYGIPVVVPENTALSEEMRAHGTTGTTFEKFTASSVVEATHRALDGFDGYARAAFIAAQDWPEKYGAEKYFDAAWELAIAP